MAGGHGGDTVCGGIGWETAEWGGHMEGWMAGGAGMLGHMAWGDTVGAHGVEGHDEGHGGGCVCERWGSPGGS